MSIYGKTRSELWDRCDQDGDEFRRNLANAQFAVKKYREKGDASGFPHVRNYVNWHGVRNSEFPCNLGGWGTELLLQGREYHLMKIAYYGTEPGKAEIEEEIRLLKEGKHDPLVGIAFAFGIGTIPVQYRTAEDYATQSPQPTKKEVEHKGILAILRKRLRNFLAAAA